MPGELPVAVVGSAGDRSEGGGSRRPVEIGRTRRAEIHVVPEVHAIRLEDECQTLVDGEGAPQTGVPVPAGRTGGAIGGGARSIADEIFRAARE